MNETVGSDFWKSQLYISIWPLWLVLYIPLAVIIGLNTPDILAGLGTILILSPLLIGLLFAQIGFIADGRALNRSEDHEYNPGWIGWFVFGLVFSPILVAPLYLYKRSRKTGRPNKDDIKRKFSIKGLLIPFH